MFLDGVFNQLIPGGGNFVKSTNNKWKLWLGMAAKLAEWGEFGYLSFVHVFFLHIFFGQVIIVDTICSQ